MINESEIIGISDLKDTRPAQIPIRRKLFQSLTKDNTPKEVGQWIVFPREDRFIICDHKTNRCVFDARLLFWSERMHSNEENPIVAVITEFRYNCEEYNNPFRILMDIFPSREP